MKKDLYDLAVASVQTDYRVVLNAGETSGVTVGMKFVIFELGEEIKDPRSGDSLGHLEVVKGRVKVTHVQPEMAIAFSDDTVRRPTVRGFASSANPTYEEVAKKLNNVQVGDSARRII